MGRGLKGAKPPKPPKAPKPGKGMPMHVPVIVPLNIKSVAGIAVALLLGAPALAVFKYKNNDANTHLEQACPVINGRLYSWGFSMACIFLFVFGVCLCRSGIVSRVLLGVGLRNEATCVGISCMGKGILGSVIDISLASLVICYNLLGTSMLYEAYEFGVTNERDSDLTWKRDAKYCDNIILVTIIAIQVLVYIGLLLVMFPYVIAMYKKCCPSVSDEEKARREAKRKRLEERPPKSLTQRWRNDPESIMNVLKIDLPESSSDEEDAPYSKEILAKLKKQREKEEKRAAKEAEKKRKKKFAV